MNSLIKINAFLLSTFLAVIGAVSYYTSNMGLPAMNNGESVSMPILMYHSVLKNTSRSGKYIVTPAEIENDIKYFQSQGYKSVSMREVIAYVENNGVLPEKPIMLTFDDGSYNNYGYIMPLLEKYDEHAIFCVVGEYTEEYSEENVANMDYGYMRWNEIRELMSSPYAEVANHSYAFHSNTGSRNGSKRKRGESPEEYAKLFRADTEKFQELFIENCENKPYIYAYPFGAYSDESFDILRELGFKATLSCNEGVNILTHDPECLYLLKRYNRPSGISSADFFQKFDEENSL